MSKKKKKKSEKGFIGNEKQVSLEPEVEVGETTEIEAEAEVEVEKTAEEQEAERKKRKHLKQAEKLLDENGELNITKYLDKIENEKKKRRKELFEKVKLYAQGVGMLVLMLYGICAGVLVLCVGLAKAWEGHKLRAHDFETSEYGLRDNYHLGSLGVDDVAIDFVALIKHYGGSDIEYRPSSNRIDFDFDRAEVMFSTVVDDEGRAVARIDMKRDSTPSYSTLDITATKEASVAYAANGCFWTSSEGLEILKFFLAADAKEPADRIDMTKEYAEQIERVREPEEEDDMGSSDDSSDSSADWFNHFH